MWMRVFLGETGRKYESSSGTKPSRAPLLESVRGSERLSAGDVPPLERSGGTEGSDPVPPVASLQTIGSAVRGVEYVGKRRAPRR